MTDQLAFDSDLSGCPLSSVQFKLYIFCLCSNIVKLSNSLYILLVCMLKLAVEHVV